jgi:MFS family permease
MSKRALGVDLTRDQPRHTYRDLLAVREFRVMWLAELLSVGGDQLGRVALAVLVFQRTESAALTGLAYGLTFVPSLLGSVFLAGLADHFARRNVMIAMDLIRAALIALVAVPGVPLWVLCVLVAVSTTFNGPFKAAQQALLPDVLDGDLYLLGMSLRTMSNQTAQVLGFAGGGVLLWALTPGGALLVDSGTFVFSAALLLGVRARPVRAREGERPLSPRGISRGFAVYRHDPRLLVLSGLVLLNLFHIVPEGLAAPYAHQLGVGVFAVGLILASAPVGGALGAFVFGRLVPDEHRAKVIGPAAIGASVSLALTFLPVGLVGSLVLFAITGGLSGIYTMYASAMVVQLAPDRTRGRVSGFLGALLQTANGLGPMLGGLAASTLNAQRTLAVAGIASAIIAIALAKAWSHVRQSQAVSVSAPAVS